MDEKTEKLTSPDTDTDNTDNQTPAELEFSPTEDALLYSDGSEEVANVLPAAEDGEAPDDGESETLDSTDGEAAAAFAAELPAPQKKKTVQKTIIISAVIVLLVIAAAAVCRLFFFQGVVNTNLFGAPVKTTWHYLPNVATPDTASTADEAAVPDFYFIFEPDGKLTIEMGTFDYQGTYTIRNAEEKDVIQLKNSKDAIGKPMLTIENSGMIDGNFLIDRSGNVFTGSTLTLTNAASEKMKLDFDSKEYKPATIERKGEFTGDEALTGTWNYSSEVGSQSFTFNADGTYDIKTKVNGTIQGQHGIYNCKDGKLTITYKDSEEKSQDFKYTIKDNKLSLTAIVEFMGQTFEQPAGEFTKAE